MSTSLRYLTHWVSGPDIDEDWRLVESEVRTNALRLDVEERPHERVALDNGAEVVVNHRVGIAGDGIIERSLWQRYGLRVNLSWVAPIEVLIDRLAELQALVSIATGRTAEFDGISFWHPDVTDGERPEPIEYYARWNARESASDQSLHQGQMFFSYPQLGGIEGVRRWMNSAAVHDEALGRVVASKFSRQMFVSDRLLNRTAALEAFDSVEAPGKV